MISIIIGTNRKDSKSEKVARIYSQILNQKNIEHQILYLENKNIITRNEEMIAIEKEFLLTSDRFIFVLPEYNGSFPGIFKLLIDNSDIKNAWWYKKVMLVGVADGRGGNLRGLDQMSNMLHYMRMNLYFHKVYLSQINTILNHQNEISDAKVLEEINIQIDGFLAY